MMEVAAPASSPAVIVRLSIIATSPLKGNSPDGDAPSKGTIVLLGRFSRKPLQREIDWSLKFQVRRWVRTIIAMIRTSN
jgi:hypothetical protein